MSCVIKPSIIYVIVSHFLSQHSRAKWYTHEDPTPSKVPTQAIHLHEAVGEDARETTDKDGNQVERCKSCLHLISHIPARNKVDASWEEAYPKALALPNFVSCESKTNQLQRIPGGIGTQSGPGSS